MLQPYQVFKKNLKPEKHKLRVVLVRKHNANIALRQVRNCKLEYGYKNC